MGVASTATSTLGRLPVSLAAGSFAPSNTPTPRLPAWSVSPSGILTMPVWTSLDDHWDMASQLHIAGWRLVPIDVYYRQVGDVVIRKLERFTGPCGCASWRSCTQAYNEAEADA